MLLISVISVNFRVTKNIRPLENFFYFFYFCGTKLLIALEDRIDGFLRQLLGEEADEPDDGEAADHRDGTAVDGIDGVAGKHVDHRETHAPDKAGPDGSRRDPTPGESQHERSEERTGQSAPRDTHELGNERRGIQGDEQ